MEYASIYKDGKQIGVITLEEISIEFLDKMFDMGYDIKNITQKEYDDYDEGDELTMDDIRNGNYREE
jgi:hypothetical protein